MNSSQTGKKGQNPDTHQAGSARTDKKFSRCNDVTVFSEKTNLEQKNTDDDLRQAAQLELEVARKQTTMTDVAKTDKPKLDTWAILGNAAKRAGQGGLAGAAAMGINVCSLMWMRTAINYQYRYGTTTTQAFKTLYADGGIPRFYRGLIPALIQGPLSRFGDTAANTGTLAALDAFEFTEKLPVAAKTVAASVAAGLFRIFLMPIDTFKTTM